MKILICIKQVPDMESKFKVDSEGIWYDRADLAWRMNEYDEYAVEQAIRLKEQVKEADLTVLCIGPGQVTETIKKALAMGCDRGVHIADADSYKKEPIEIAAMIAGFAQDKNFDIIFTGMQSQDRGSAQVGVMVAELLGIPAVTTIVDFLYENGTIQVKRELEGGSKAVVTTGTPVLLTCQLGLNTPRYPTLPNIMKAKKKELLTVEGSTGDISRMQATAACYFPEKKGGGLVLEGDVAELADKLIQILKEKTSILA
ncbi:electron transfer flavoprotein subunit beta/FixA family protein [Desulfobulbus oligotrophicus]|jgi:electron transfer flavoprotein beta subunit|uniref:Electron transfer flavoprotein subunit beta n=1 Tax=Desulfobulbus oligotrophicus TaxID=1909699 RepID=A0A7T6AQL7_9BACT|nr:electron transfer flavoprotein subunit beta/FixA family protein [Desulfobulbus oligotrophicus]MDY0391367.1 electron transfer flavoprotein subunit beta/FixA family protein [Desulfobulbus oligotrophicus]QQG65613.1 electron transfer flavoprotein subunit beta/FixA family protein [Desulfobulbus oligotrophicus]